MKRAEGRKDSYRAPRDIPDYCRPLPQLFADERKANLSALRKTRFVFNRNQIWFFFFFLLLGFICSSVENFYLHETSRWTREEGELRRFVFGDHSLKGKGKGCKGSNITSQPLLHFWLYIVYCRIDVSSR